MIQRITKSISVAVKVAILGFEESYRKGKSIDSILGYTDSLTKIPNRKAFKRDKDKVDEKYSLIMIDIDNLKNINDANGHLFGDRVLKRLAEILREVVGQDGKAYRIGGDEFLLIVPRSELESVCNTIQKNVRREDSFTVSQGVVYTVEKGVPKKLIKQADTALYQSKARGKNKITTAIPVIV
jgi:diguanylate cyclase (GGDEF)-like protein